jgi:hypothetical protein
MPKTRINCPNCRQPVVAEIDQLFDVTAEPATKQRFLAGEFNQIRCPTCGYQGGVATPIVYHDADKELLLTFVPTEIGLSRDEQERVIGGLINQIITRLPQDKRKGYLLRPQAVLSLQGLVERVLEGEGVTREMIQSQQLRISLLQRLMSASSEEVRLEIARQEDRLIDGEFFTLLRRLAEAALMGGDQESAQQLAALQESLLPVTTFGKQMMDQTKEVEAVVADLQAIGRELTREKLLELVISSPSETRLRALVSLTRPAMDYQFFQLLSERIDHAQGDEQKQLGDLRQKLLDFTRQIDQQIEARTLAARQTIEALTKTPNVEEAMAQNLGVVDEFFIQELNQAMDSARKQGNLEKIEKLNQIASVLQRAEETPPEVELIEQLLDAESDEQRRKILIEHNEEITPEFIAALNAIMAQIEASQDKELIERMRSVNRMAIRFSMEMNLK